MKVHELEHLIQEHDHGSAVTGPNAPNDARDLFAMARVQYFTEKHAMRAEWAFLHSVPSAEKEALIGILRSDRLLDPTARDQMIRTLADSPLTVDEYVSRQHAAGRYALASVIRDQFAFAKDRNAGRLRRISTTIRC